MCVAGRMLLRLEQRVEVPEAALHVVVGRHLLEAHLCEDLAELSPNLGEREHGGRMSGVEGGANTEDAFPAVHPRPSFSPNVVALPEPTLSRGCR